MTTPSDDRIRELREWLKRHSDCGALAVDDLLSLLDAYALLKAEVEELKRIAYDRAVERDLNAD
jgi:hypothetical protein